MKQNGRNNENNLNQVEAYSMDQRIYKNDRWLPTMILLICLQHLYKGPLTPITMYPMYVFIYFIYLFYLEAEEVLPRAHMEEGVARMLHKLNDMVGTEGAAVLHAVQQLRVVDEDGELGPSPVLPPKLLK